MTVLPLLLLLLFLLLLLLMMWSNFFKVRENEEDEEGSQQETTAVAAEPLSSTASLTEVRTRPKIINIYQVSILPTIYVASFVCFTLPTTCL